MKKISSQDLQNLTLQNEGAQERSPKTPFPILAVDYGLSWSGLAYSPDGLITLPLEVVKTDELQMALKKAVQSKNIKQIVLGIPIDADGTEAPLVQTIRTLGRLWQSRMPVTYVDERFSSKSTFTKTSKRQEREDDLAAQQILEYFLAQK